MQFWVLKPNLDEYWWSLVLSKRAESLGKENWWEVFRGNRPPTDEPAPFRVCDVRAKNEQGDVMCTDLLGLSFSARLADVLLSVQCRGFTPRASIIYDLRDHTVVCENAKWTVFADGCGPVDTERGYNSAKPFRGTIGLFFDHATWNGLDIFRPALHPAVVITDRIAQAILAHDFKGYVLERAEEYGIGMVSRL